MASDQYLTTQRKDFVWPYVKTLPLKTSSPKTTGDEEREKNCRCYCLETKGFQQLDSLAGVQILGPLATQDSNWIKPGPLPPLLDPVIYPAKVGAPPEGDISRFDQPNVFMRQLNERYPFLYGVLQTAPPDDLIQRVNQSQLLSTYQADYCHKGEYPSHNYDTLLAAARVEGMPPCPQPERIHFDKCPPLQRRQRLGGGHGHGHGHGHKHHSGGGGASHLDKLPQPVSEYMDKISGTGNLIVRERLLYPIEDR